MACHRYCVQPEGEAWLASLVDDAATLLLDRVGRDRVLAVVLTGSVARAEASVLRGADGLRLLGDVELLVILRSPGHFAEMRRSMVALSREATRVLGAGGRAASVEYSPADADYLRRRIRPSIFAYDLKTHGRVLWGPADLLASIVPFGADEIPREDALELALNRTLELSSGEGGDEPDRAGYQVVKTVLDLAGSALAFSRAYVSPYASRPRAYTSLARREPELYAALGGEAFVRELEAAARAKLAPALDLLPLRDLEVRRARVLEWCGALCVWEMRRMLGCPSASLVELIDAYLADEPVTGRLRGWLKYGTHPLRPPRALRPARALRLLGRGSPRRLVYAATLLARSAEHPPREEWKEYAAALLPVPGPSGNGDVLRRAADVWRWLVRNN